MSTAQEEADGAVYYELVSSLKALNSDQRIAAAQIIAALTVIGPNATAMLVDCAKGHVIGKSYGDWVVKKDFVKEAQDEARDGRNYVGHLLRAAKAFEEAHSELEEAKKAVA